MSKARLKRDVKQTFFRDTSNVDIIAFDCDLHETLNSLPKQQSEWNVNEKFDFIVRSMKSLADIHMPVWKYTRREYKPKLKPWITLVLSNIETTCFTFTKDQNHLQFAKFTNNSETASLMSGN